MRDLHTVLDGAIPRPETMVDLAALWDQGRRRRRRRRTAVLVLATFSVVGVSAVAVVSRDSSSNVRVVPADNGTTSAGVDAGVGSVVVPDVVGAPVSKATATLRKVGLRGLVFQLDSQAADATVVAHEPPAGSTVPRGSVVGFRTAAPRPSTKSQCPKAINPRTGGGDGLPPAPGDIDVAHMMGLVDSSREQILATYRSAVAVYLAHRDGDVWYRTSSGAVRTRRVRDYQMVVVLTEAADCPTMPNGLAFVVEPRAPRIGTLSATLVASGPAGTSLISGTVTARDGSGHSITGTTTDGRINFQLPPGVYTVTATSPHYQYGQRACTTKSPATVTAATTLTVTITCDEF